MVNTLCKKVSACCYSHQIKFSAERLAQNIESCQGECKNNGSTIGLSSETAQEARKKIANSQIINILIFYLQVKIGRPQARLFIPGNVKKWTLLPLIVLV